VGTLGTIGLFGTLIGGLGMGFLADRIGRRPAIIICTVGFGVFMLLFATSHNYDQLLVLRFLAGFFLGGFCPSPGR
jgi:AAHS family 4-hydroxybenzoate transporter-like MFS transporter